MFHRTKQQHTAFLVEEALGIRILLHHELMLFLCTIWHLFSGYWENTFHLAGKWPFRKWRWHVKPANCLWWRILASIPEVTCEGSRANKTPFAVSPIMDTLPRDDSEMTLWREKNKYFFYSLFTLESTFSLSYKYACRPVDISEPPPPKKKNTTNKQVITLKILIKQYNSFFLFISLNLKALWTCTCSSS